MQIAICEDDAGYIELLCQYIKEISLCNQLDATVVASFQNARSAEDWLITKIADVWLLDIGLESADSGYTLAARIKAKNPQSQIIFITEQMHYLQLAFRIHAFDYLPKPVTRKVLENCLLDLYRMQQPPLVHDTDAAIWSVRLAGSIKKLHTSEIVLIEKQRNVAIIKMQGRQLQCYMTLEQIEKELAPHGFLRCHKGFVVNLKHVIAFRSTKLLLNNAMECPVGRGYWSMLKLKGLAGDTL